MKLLLDSHTHTCASGHAYSTILENARAAADRGLQLLAITEHAPAMQDAPRELFFVNMDILDRELYGVEMLYGAELNILDYRGKLDLGEAVYKHLDLCVASFHDVLLSPGSRAENTRAILGAMQHPSVNVIGHPDDGNIPVDYEELVREAKRTGVMLEVNNASIETAYFRLHSRENYTVMLGLCEKYGAMVTVGSDAHFATRVGHMPGAVSLLEELRFPQELIANLSVERFRAGLRAKA